EEQGWRHEWRAEHGGFSAGCQTYGWDDHCAAVGPKATATQSHYREEHRPPRRPSTSPLPSSLHRQIGST
ncbi:hypothetical protein ACOIBK_28435, partial [Klebsiella pneumoniae]|uniref:hypothetical protein n=1 Tax=Klebsiella pneumoniae TaxID=573 RepID=UPI003B5B40E8